MGLFMDPEAYSSFSEREALLRRIKYADEEFKTLTADIRGSISVDLKTMDAIERLAQIVFLALILVMKETHESA